MDSLTDLYNQKIVPLDQALEKQAAEMVKEAEEEEFAGRIMARGFADEMNKLAGGDPYKLKYSAGGAAQKSRGGMPGRTSSVPSMPGAKPAAGPTAKAGPSVKSPFNSPSAAGAVTGKLSLGKMPAAPGQSPTRIASK